MPEQYKNQGTHAQNAFEDILRKAIKHKSSLIVISSPCYDISLCRPEGAIPLRIPDCMPALISHIKYLAEIDPNDSAQATQNGDILINYGKPNRVDIAVKIIKFNAKEVMSLHIA
jgi:hypothetical protein